MALIQNYESDPISYAAIDPSDDYHEVQDWLSDPPREYEEAISRDGEYIISTLPGVFSTPTPSRHGAAATYVALVVVAARNISGASFLFQRFDSSTGAYLGRTGVGGLSYVTITYITMGRRNEVWVQSTLGGGVRQLDPETYEFGAALPIQPSELTPAGGGEFAVDSTADLFLATAPGDGGEGLLRVYQLSTGTLVRTVAIGSVIRQVCLEDESRCYCICDSGLFVLVDYVEGRIIGTHRAQLTPNFDTSGDEGARRYTWDPYHRRILTLEHELDTEETGAPNWRIRGYFPIPVASHLGVPIPLVVPREGRTVRVASRVTGSDGSGLSGQTVTAEATGDARLLGGRSASDQYGYASFNLACDNDGSVDVDVEMEIDDE